MNKYYRINEITQLTSVSVRTLHYYDEIKLLSPSYRTDSGHRLYSKNDLVKLQQIMTLKFMGFPLKQIQSILQQPHFDIHESLKAQSMLLKKEAEKIETVYKLIDHLVEVNSIDWESIIKIIQILQSNESEKQKWFEKYLTQDELSEINNLGYSDEFWMDYHKRWADMIDEVRQHLNTDPESETGIKLAKKWLGLVNEVYAGKPELIKKLWDSYKSGMIPGNQMPYDKAIISYITKACEKLNENDIN